MLRIAIILLFLVCEAAYPEVVAADSMNDMHKQSAFTYAKRKVWSLALEHARMSHSDILIKYFTWEYLKDPESDASFDEITKFIDHNPDWPDQALLEKHAEVALMADNPSDEVLNEWFSKHPPQTNFVKLKMAKNE